MLLSQRLVVGEGLLLLRGTTLLATSCLQDRPEGA